MFVTFPWGKFQYYMFGKNPQNRIIFGFKWWGMLYIRVKSTFGQEFVRYLMSVLNFSLSQRNNYKWTADFCLQLQTNFSFVRLLVIGQFHYGPYLVMGAQRRENIDLSIRKIFPIGLPLDADPYLRCGEKSFRS